MVVWPLPLLSHAGRQQLLSWVSTYSTAKDDFVRATFKLTYLYPISKIFFLPGAPAYLVPSTFAPTKRQVMEQ